MDKNIIAAIIGYIRNGMNNYEIVGTFDDQKIDWYFVQIIRVIVIFDAIKLVPIILQRYFNEEKKDIAAALRNSPSEI